MKVEIFADITCPWCYIGERRFQNALAQFADAHTVDVVHRPFQLDPSAPAEARPLSEYLAQRFGEISGSVTRRVSTVAEQEGISINWERALSANTRDAHRLLRLAGTEYGADVQQALLEALFAAHFTHGQDVSDHETLVELGRAAGIDAGRAAAYLAGQEGAREVDQELQHAYAMGIRGVPLFVFDELYAVEGAQPTETFLQALEEVRRRSLDDAPAHNS